MGRTNKTDDASTKKNSKVISGRAGKKSASLGSKAPRAGYGGKAPRKGLAAADQHDKERKPHRWRPGTVALREIRAMQRSTDLLLRKKPFIRFVRALSQEFDPELRFQAGALALLQVALENELTGTYSVSQVAALHAKRVTLSARDIRVARRITSMAPGKPLTQSPLHDAGFAFSALPVRAKSKSRSKKDKGDAMEGVERAQNAAAAAAADGDAADEEEPDEPNTEEAAINPLVQAVAQEMTVRDEPPAAAPGTPKERRAPATPTKDKKKQKAGAKKDDAAVNQFNDDDMAVFQ